MTVLVNQTTPFYHRKYIFTLTFVFSCFRGQEMKIVIQNKHALLLLQRVMGILSTVALFM